MDHHEVNAFNSIDLNDLYNLNRCLGGECISNTLSSQIPIRTIEEIAALRSARPQAVAALQSAVNEKPFEDSSPIFGDPQQFYAPITKEQSEEYPTPAIVNEEIRQSNKNSGSKADNAGDLFVPYQVTRDSLQYLNGFIKTQIGRRVSIDFLIGSDIVTTKTGYLLAVAQNYLLLNELDTNDVTACDLYTLKFIRFYY